MEDLGILARAKPQAPSFYGQDMLKGLSKDPEAVAGQFESMFYRSLFKQMRDSQIEEPLFGGSNFEQMQAMQHDEMASYLGAQGKLGIKEMILEEIESRQGTAMEGEKNLGLLKNP